MEQSLKKITKIVSTYSGSVELKIFQTNPQKMIFSKFVKNIGPSDLNEIKINQTYGQDSIWTYVNSILKNLKTDVNNSANLFTSISKDFTVIAESGIKSSSDIAMYNELGIFNFLIGESILKANDYSAFIKTLLING